MFVTTVTLLSLALTNRPTPADQPRVPSGWVRPFVRLGLLADGYTPVPLLVGRQTGWPFVLATAGGVAMTLLVDTGGNGNVLDPEWVREHVPEAIGYKKPADGKPPVLRAVDYGRRFHVRVGMAGLESPAMPFTYRRPELALLAPDDGIAASEGILGTPFLQYYSVVIDYGSGNLYLLDPARREAGLQGEWVGTGLHHDGREGKLSDYVDHLRLVVRGSDAVLTADKLERRFSVGLDLSKTPRQMDLMMPDGRGFWTIYRLEGDTLLLAAELFDDGKPSQKQKRPTAFTTAPGDPHSVVTFRRVKPKP